MRVERLAWWQAHCRSTVNYELNIAFVALLLLQGAEQATGLNVVHTVATQVFESDLLNNFSLDSETFIF